MPKRVCGVVLTAATERGDFPSKTPRSAIVFLFLEEIESFDNNPFDCFLYCMSKYVTFLRT